MQKNTILALLAALCVGACQNGVLATPFGDYGLKSRDGNRVTYGFLPKKAQVPQITMPQGFQGYWVHTDNLKQRQSECRGDYIGDDGVRLRIDAANNKLSLGFYEAGADAHWLSLSQQSSNQISGKLSYAFSDEGGGEPQISEGHASMTLINNGKELVAKNLVGENLTTVFLLCKRNPELG